MELVISNARGFAKKNAVMLIAFAAALITSLFVPVDKEYIGYFDFKTLSCLFCVLAVVCAVVPPVWFWVPYFIQVANLSGAAGDLYVTARFRKLQDTILVNDTGVAMTVYDRSRQ